jgi:hypothetical protein
MMTAGNIQVPVLNVFNRPDTGDLLSNRLRVLCTMGPAFCPFRNGIPLGTATNRMMKKLSFIPIKKMLTWQLPYLPYHRQQHEEKFMLKP